MFSRLCRLLVCVASSVLPLAALAQAWPSQTVKIVVPTPAGSSVDIAARVIGERLTPMLGQPVIVENRPGAGGTIGSDVVAKARDGHTLLMGYNGPLTVAPALYPKLPYDPAKDFVPVILVVTQPNVLAVRSELKVNNIKELVALAKSKPGKLDYASVGNGSLSHLSMEMLKMTTGSFIVHIPFNGGPPAAQALNSGEVHMAFAALSNVQPLLKAGKVKLIAVSNGRRSVAAPDVPTVAEQGFPGFDATTWNGLLMPAGTPKDVVNKINKAVAQILAQPEVQARLLAAGAESAGSTPEQFGALMKSELAAWPAVVKRSGAKLD
ncbi:tripartite tricarboxylate transporter substrate binding protein [Uliginosibacterium sp. 31-16]|uniref:Bug family tripartite tricarboxylate transporter substrate binding protein n=1 Tax=Uliginosibacterium sp. 31-16 TaxID=3068315 RepID=UPI00273E45D1|nr:tripartite tricarboxylate transporter substrate binding protein [Uliginosibacterium sp. 31-16]MDP5239073.1 tripartite tricarboxylate transporter substrate binding protein [Uliginosibacterium sp. 31-16]